MSTTEYDLIVIGSGPGGEGAAMQATKQGLRVAIVEKYPRVGGNCTHLGTIPSKALRQIAHRLTTFQKDPLYNKTFETKKLKFKDLLHKASSVISEQVERRQSHYYRNNVDVIQGHASFIGPKTISVSQADNPDKQLTAEKIILASGSRPNRPEDIDFSHPRIFDSDTILKLQGDPKVITIYGAGVIGCEYTCIFRALGLKVNLINTRSKLLNFLDDEIIDALSYHLRDQGVIIRHGEEYQKVEADDQRVVLTLKSGKRIKSDIIFFAAGRTGNSDKMNLPDAGIKISKYGHIPVDSHYMTTAPGVYAVGDLTGFPALASSAYDQGRFAACHVLDQDCDDRLVKDVPIGIYTTPEISCIGKTEAQLTEERIPYEVGHVAFRHLARAQIVGTTAGMLKLLFNPDSLELLGVHCFGYNATEIIHIGQTIMAQQGPANTIRYFINTTFNYPTMAEAYRVAALNGLNRVYNVK